MIFQRCFRPTRLKLFVFLTGQYVPLSPSGFTLSFSILLNHFSSFQRPFFVCLPSPPLSDFSQASTTDRRRCLMKQLTPPTHSPGFPTAKRRKSSKEEVRMWESVFRTEIPKSGMFQHLQKQLSFFPSEILYIGEIWVTAPCFRSFLRMGRKTKIGRRAGPETAAEKRMQRSFTEGEKFPGL